jgi:hypothetical protein
MCFGKIVLELFKVPIGNDGVAIELTQSGISVLHHILQLVDVADPDRFVKRYTRELLLKIFDVDLLVCD